MVVKTRHLLATEGDGPPAFFSPDVARARRFYLDLNPPKRQRLAVVCGGLEHCATHYAIHRANFPFYSVEYVARGSGGLKLNGRTYALRTGRVFSYGPGVPHDITGDPGNPFVKYFVDFTGKNAARLLRSCGLPPGSLKQVFPPHILCPLFDELIEGGRSGGHGNAELCAKLLECLALKLARTNVPLEETETLAFASYQRCRRHIEQHFLRLRTLEEVAVECHADKAYLCRLFRSYGQQSPYQYLLRLKMDHAAKSLQEPGALVKQVAQEVGFDDPFHFSRVFGNVLGMSPSAFRKFR
ncbi:MAG TPA: AraC family transcriptional regulator [Methylomirabilota bacterium]|nr:AraC family transcriptional regulator [Methylomirabilota bacterium]